MPNSNQIPSEQDSLAGLSLLVMFLAQYFAGNKRSKLIAWLELEADRSANEGIKEVHLRYIRG
jgi:hypothetical protein